MAPNGRASTKEPGLQKVGEGATNGTYDSATTILVELLLSLCD